VQDIDRVFQFIQKPTQKQLLQQCKHLILSPIQTRNFFLQKLQHELKLFKQGKPAEVILKLNSLADPKLIQELYALAEEGMPIKLILRSICCLVTEQKKWPQPIQATSIVDEYLEHARVLYFNHGGKNLYYISSSDWMVRNLDYRVEVSAPIYDASIKMELKQILDLQLSENVKARVLDNEQKNHYVESGTKRKLRSQLAIYQFLKKQKY
jgi:polyphosphate kinase